MLLGLLATNQLKADVPCKCQHHQSQSCCSPLELAGTLDPLIPFASHANLVVSHDRGHPEPISEVFCLHSLRTNPECRHNEQVTTRTWIGR